MSSNSGGSSSPDLAFAICAEKGKAIMRRNEAKRVAKRQAKRSGRNVTPFPCDACGGWHVGSKRPSFRGGRVMREGASAA